MALRMSISHLTRTIIIPLVCPAMQSAQANSRHHRDGIARRARGPRRTPALPTGAQHPGDRPPARISARPAGDRTRNIVACNGFEGRDRRSGCSVRMRRPIWRKSPRSAYRRSDILIWFSGCARLSDPPSGRRKVRNPGIDDCGESSRRRVRPHWSATTPAIGRDCWPPPRCTSWQVMRILRS